MDGIGHVVIGVRNGIKGEKKFAPYLILDPWMNFVNLRIDFPEASLYRDKMSFATTRKRGFFGDFPTLLKFMEDHFKSMGEFKKLLSIWDDDYEKCIPYFKKIVENSFFNKEDLSKKIIKNASDGYELTIDDATYCSNSDGTMDKLIKGEICKMTEQEQESFLKVMQNYQESNGVQLRC